MKHFHQCLLLATFLPLCWLAMMAVHELGHVLAAYATGGTVTKVVLHPLAISRTDVAPNPQPLAVVWAGPMVGIFLPLLVWILFAISKIQGVTLLRFFSGFCLIANGVYIGIGSFNGIGDAGEMIRHGAPRWLLLLFGAITVPLGLSIWHRLGPQFGFGPSRGQVDSWAAYASLTILTLAVTTMLILG